MKKKDLVIKIIEKSSIYYEIIGKTQKDSLNINSEFDISIDKLKELNSGWFKKYFKEN